MTISPTRSEMLVASNQPSASAAPNAAERQTIAVVQQVLRAAGHHAVPVDGRLGSATLTALGADVPSPGPHPPHPTPHPRPVPSLAHRMVAYCSPFIAIAAGVVTAWLGRHFPGLAIGGSADTQLLVQAAELALGTAVTWALHHKLLDVWLQWATSQPRSPAG